MFVVHYAIQGNGHCVLKEGQEVSYDLGMASKGPQAENVKVI